MTGSLYLVLLLTTYFLKQFVRNFSKTSVRRIHPLNSSIEICLQSNKTTTTTTTVKPNKLSSNIASKRVDNDLETKGGNFPIYIPVDDMETSESQIYFKNVTLQQNFAWATENKHSKAHLVKPKIVYESPLVNGGIPISPGEIITANSDVIVGKPAVGGPLTLAASGIKLQNPVHPPVIDNVVANNDRSRYDFSSHP